MEFQVKMLDILETDGVKVFKVQFVRVTYEIVPLQRWFCLFLKDYSSIVYQRFCQQKVVGIDPRMPMLMLKESVPIQL